MHRGRDRHVESASSDLRRDERGAVAVEYVVVLILVVIAAITAWVEWREAVENDASNEYQTFGYPP